MSTVSLRARRTALLSLLVVFGAVLCGSAATHPAQAAPLTQSQTPPSIPLPTIPPLPPLPPQLQPALELISPIAAPGCANAVLVGVLVPSLGVPIPPELQTALGPLFVVCGSIPQPSGNGRTCTLDLTLQDLLSQAGVPLPLLLKPSQMIYNQVLQIEKSQATIVPALPIIPLSSNIAAVLQCLEASAPTPLPTPTSGRATPATPATSAPEPAAMSPSSNSIAPLPGGPLRTPAGVANHAMPAPTESVSFIGSSPFAYPAAMLFPIGLLVLGGYVHRTLMQPVPPRSSPSAMSGDAATRMHTMAP